MYTAAAAREVVAKEGTAVENPEGGANTSDPLTQARRKRRRGSKADSSAAALQAAEPAGGDAEEQSEGQAVNADLPEGGVVGHWSTFDFDVFILVALQSLS